MNESLPDVDNAAPAAQPQAPEQLRYARWLEWGTWLGFTTLVISFALYVFQVLPAHVAPERLPSLWGLPVDEFVARTGTPTGWGWLAMLPRADALGLGGIVLLSGCSLACLLAVAPLYWRRGDRAHAVIAVAIVAVIVLAASGVLVGRH